jgi:DNA-binding HxlR family transcriptional regulator
MQTSRRYGDGCAIAIALDNVGERWALLIVRELLLGPKRFTDLQEGLPRAGAKVLAQRLKELEASGVLGRRRLPPPASAQVYELTERGTRLEPVVVALGHWGAESAQSSSDPVGADSAVLRLRSLFNAQPKRPWSATYELRLGRHRFTARVTDGRLVEVRRGEPQGPPDAIVDTDPDTFSRILGVEGGLGRAIDEGRLALTGDGRAGRRLFDAARN